MILFQGFDRAYLEALRSGDADTEGHFIGYFNELIQIKLRARNCSRPLIEDVRQETFLRVFRALRSPAGIREPERLGPFVNSVCNNVLKELLRSQQRHGRPPADAPPDVPDGGPDVESRLLGEERCTLVHRVIDELPDRDRRLLQALFVEEEDKNELCARLGVGRSYLRVLLYRAKASFRTRLAERHPAANA